MAIRSPSAIVLLLDSFMAATAPAVMKKKLTVNVFNVRDNMLIKIGVSRDRKKSVCDKTIIAAAIPRKISQIDSRGEESVSLFIYSLPSIVGKYNESCYEFIFLCMPPDLMVVVYCSNNEYSLYSGDFRTLGSYFFIR